MPYVDNRVTGKKRLFSSATAEANSKYAAGIRGWVNHYMRTRRSTRQRRRTRSRRGRRYSRSRRTGSKKFRKVYRIVVKERPPKHCLYSDQGVTGSNQVGFTTSQLRGDAPALAFLSRYPRVVSGQAYSSGTVQQRIGDRTFTTRISLNCLTYIGPGVSGDVNIKWMLFVRKDSQGTSLTATAFAGDYFGTINPATNCIPNLNNKDVSARYHILKSGIWRMKETLANVTENQLWHIEWRANPVETNWTLGSSGTEASVDSGGIYLFMMADNGAESDGINTYIEGNLYFRDQA